MSADTNSELTWEQSFALFDAVAAVLDKHLTHGRWQPSINPDDPDDDAANGWVPEARLELARVVEESVLLHRNGDPERAEEDFEDLRDYLLWQAMVDLAREKDGEPCHCDCHASA